MISLNKIEEIFNEDVVAELAATAKLPSGADVARFASNLRLSAQLFLEAKARASRPQLRQMISRLYSLNTCAGRGTDVAARRLARAVAATPADVWWWLSRRTPQAQNIPTTAEILSPGTRQYAVERLRLILSAGGSQVLGRKRQCGKRSRSFKPLLRMPLGNQHAKDKRGRPKGDRGRPRGNAEREFLQ